MYLFIYIATWTNTQCDIGYIADVLLWEKFEYIKGVIRRCKSKKKRQYNGQKKKDKVTNSDLQNTTSLLS
jgi:hypothetical protein